MNSTHISFVAAAGLFRVVAKAAGRCNRNGELRDEADAEILGCVYAFDHDCYAIPKQLMDLLNAAADAGQIRPQHMEDLLALQAIERYFRLHIWTIGQRTNKWDQPDIMGCFPEMHAQDRQFTIQFREAARRFEMIPRITYPLVIPWGKRARRCVMNSLNKFGHFPNRSHSRRAQRYRVHVYVWDGGASCSTDWSSPCTTARFIFSFNPKAITTGQTAFVRPTLSAHAPHSWFNHSRL